MTRTTRTQNVINVLLFVGLAYTISLLVCDVYGPTISTRDQTREAFEIADQLHVPVEPEELHQIAREREAEADDVNIDGDGDSENNDNTENQVEEQKVQRNEGDPKQAVVALQPLPDKCNSSLQIDKFNSSTNVNNKLHADFFSQIERQQSQPSSQPSPCYMNGCWRHRPKETNVLSYECAAAAGLRKLR